MKTRLVLVGLSLFCASLVAAPVGAQVYTGRIDVTIKDGTGAVLPGVTVEAVGPQTDVAVTDTQGGVHFVNLAPGRYTVTAKLSGFTDYRNENVPVNAGSIVPLVVTLGVGGLAERVEVTQETPVIETKRQTVSTNVNLDELQNIPSARDPWVVLQTIPGIIVDRVNVGGAESGQQSNYQAKGANPDQNTWNMDGICDHRHGLARRVPDLLRLRHVPGDAGHDRRRRSRQRHAGRAAELRAARAAPASGAGRRATTSRTTASSPTTSRPISSARLPATTGSASTRTGASRAAGRSSRDGSSPGARTARPSRRSKSSASTPTSTTTPDRPRRDDAREHLGEGHRRGVVEDARQLHLLPRQQAEVRPRRVGLPSRRDDLQPGRSDRPLQGRAEPDDRDQPVPRRSLRAYEERVLARAARRSRRPVLSRRFQRVSRVVRLVPDPPAAGQRVARRQQVQGPARPEVRVRVEEGERHVRERLAGQRRSHLPPRLPEHAGARRPRLVARPAKANTGTPTSAIRSASTG